MPGLENGSSIANAFSWDHTQYPGGTRVFGRLTAFLHHEDDRLVLLFGKGNLRFRQDTIDLSLQCCQRILGRRRAVLPKCRVDK